MKDKICCCSERFVIKADDFSTTRSPDSYRDYLLLFTRNLLKCRQKKVREKILIFEKNTSYEKLQLHRYQSIY
jgi:hypothetical protein